MASRLDIGLTSQNASALGRVVEIIIKPPEKTIVMHIKSNYFHRKGLLMYKIKTLIIVLSKLNEVFFPPKADFDGSILRRIRTKSSGRIGTCSCQGRLCGSVGGSLAGAALLSPSLEL